MRRVHWRTRRALRRLPRRPSLYKLTGITRVSMKKHAAAKFRTLLWIATVVLTFHPPARAQVATADLVGTITDASGSAVPGAIVTARNTGTGLSYNAVA